jgi:hypothetical protein
VATYNGDIVVVLDVVEVEEVVDEVVDEVVLKVVDEVVDEVATVVLEVVDEVVGAVVDDVVDPTVDVDDEAAVVDEPDGIWFTDSFSFEICTEIVANDPTRFACCPTLYCIHRYPLNCWPSGPDAPLHFTIIWSLCPLCA